MEALIIAGQNAMIALEKAVRHELGSHASDDVVGSRMGEAILEANRQRLGGNVVPPSVLSAMGEEFEKDNKKNID